MFYAWRICWKFNTRRSKINKPVQRITIQFRVQVNRPTFSKPKIRFRFCLSFRYIKHSRNIHLEIFVQLLPIHLLIGKNIFQNRVEGVGGQ